MDSQRNEVVYLYLDDIIPNRFQPRENFDEKALNELASSIKEHGVIQPIIVRSLGNRYEIIAGERRYKASALAGLTKIPAIVRNLDDKESAKVALLENLQRKDLSPIEEARTYQKILELDELTQEELAKTMGKSQSAVPNKLRLLTLSDEVQDALLKEKISERHARSLLNVTDPMEQANLLNKVIETRMTVRELEQEIQKKNHKEEEVVEEHKPKFFDFGINPDVQETKPEEVHTVEESPAMETPNLEDLRSTAKDINTEKQVADLDSLLRLNEEDDEEKKEEIETEQVKEPDYKFIMPEDKKEENTLGTLESLLRANSVSIEEKKEDTTPLEEKEVEIETLSLDSETPKEESITEKESINELKEVPVVQEEPKQEPYIWSMRSAINELRDTIRSIEKSGFVVDSEEVDLKDSYQITIKIEKKEEDPFK